VDPYRRVIRYYGTKTGDQLDAMYTFDESVIRLSAYAGEVGVGGVM